ncbi:AAA family ATPase [Photobacterium damselae subsp. piscicida]|nr:AAA family ATPase [Photobacterium damselae subsp. piscicida]TJZ83681.1 AAA family ATPase [Photobacterium damselae subsp. piscicida]
MVNDFNKEQLDYYLEVWAFITQELSTNISNYIKRIAGLEKAIDGINRVITSQQEQETVLREELKELSKNTTSVQPTVDEINRMLNFKIVPSRDNANNYSLQRENGELALDTLSEGEVTFITFLYFIQLAKGGTTRENVVGDRILVIDDPISSLDSNILFIVSTIIKNIINDVKDGSHIKQLLLFTHNVYFHKEASFQGGRSNGCNKTNYWILRKKNNITNIQAYGQNNPIESSYELLWKEISEPEKLSLTTIQNTMRRILENYFKILGRYSDNDIIEKFTNNEEKQMCKSLLYWINDGSHCIPDDLFIENQDQSMEGYLHIFKKVFEYSGHIAHYNMMMGISQNNTLAAIESV